MLFIFLFLPGYMLGLASVAISIFLRDLRVLRAFVVKEHGSQARTVS
jgi:hypothetical protein